MEEVPSGLQTSLLVETKERCKALRRRAGTLVHSEFASESPRQLLKLFARLAGELQHHLDSVRPSLDELRIVNDLICELAAHLRYAEAALSSRLPWSLPRPFEDLLKRFLPHATVMLRPQWHHNFSIIMDDLGDYYRRALVDLKIPTDRQNAVFADFPGDFYILSFPAIERLNVLLHCDLAHELGHLVTEVYLRQESTGYIKEFTDAIRDRNPGAKTSLIRAELNQAIEIRRRAIEELGADMFAMQCLGPAAILALASILMADGLDQSPDAQTDYYPPGRYRLRAALQFLRRAGLLPKQAVDSRDYAPLLTYFDALRACVSQQSDKDALSRGGHLVEQAYESVRRTLPRLRRYLRNTYGDRFIDKGDLYQEATELVGRLALGLPPNEVREACTSAPDGPLYKPARLEAILNAAWFYRLLYLDTGPNDAAARRGPRDIRTLGRLTLKGIELSRVAADYNRWIKGEHT